MSFQRIDIKLPPEWNCKVIGFLCDSDDARDLGQDMVEIRIPRGIRINAGWYPESSPKGKYQVSVKIGDAKFSFHPGDAYETERMIRSIVEENIAGQSPICESESIEDRMEPKAWDAYQLECA